MLSGREGAGQPAGLSLHSFLLQLLACGSQAPALGQGHPITCTHVLGFQNISLGTHLSPLSQEPRMDPTKPRKLPGSPGQERGVNRQEAWLPGGQVGGSWARPVPTAPGPPAQVLRGGV